MLLNWLGKQDLFQTFLEEVLTDEEQIRDIHEIRNVLADYISEK